ncbi:MAG: hypothetical protein WAX07_10760 [Candidatus Altiarchaeia archaeon]|jgi:hypothetical protein
MNENTDLDVVKELRSALEKRNPYLLRELSDQCADIAFITQNPDAINVGIISYSFHKIFLKRHYQSQFGELLENANRKINAGNLEGLMEDVKQFDKKNGFFQGNVVKKARIKLGARLYSRGMSLSKAAELVAVNVSDILKYSGGTQVSEKTNGETVRERLETARKIFGNA